MRQLPADEWTEILYLALVEPIGLLVQASDVERARQRFYKARSDALDGALATLQLRVSPWPEEGNLVIVKSTVEVKRDQLPILSPSEQRS